MQSHHSSRWGNFLSDPAFCMGSISSDPSGNKSSFMAVKYKTTNDVTKCWKVVCIGCDSTAIHFHFCVHV